MTLLFENKSEQKGNISNASWAYQNIVNTSRNNGYPVYVEGYLDLTNMSTVDVINIEENIWIGGTSIVYESKNFSGIQYEPALHFHSKFAPKGIYNLKMNQSYGTPRNYSYHFIILNMTGG